MAGHPIAAITGLGFSALSRKPGPSARRLACDAVRDAAADAGLALSSIDGLLLNRSPIEPFETLPLTVQRDLGLRDLRLLASIEGEGSSAVQMIHYAALAIQSGMVERVACVFADAPIAPGVNAGQAFAIALPMTGIDGWEREIGFLGAAPAFALVAARYMALYGAQPEAFGAWAIAEREWAMRNPRAFLKQPLSIEDYLASRPIARPLRLLDCAYPVNGAVAFIVGRADSADQGPRPPAYIHGMGQGHGGCPAFGDLEPEFDNGAATAGRIAYEMAGIGPDDVSSAQFYAPFTCAGIVALENYGFCQRGEGADFVAAGQIRPGGKLPVNTGGGMLSGFYLQGATSLCEAVIQARGDGGERQVANDVVLATGLGGRQDHHAALILSPHASLA